MSKEQVISVFGIEKNGQPSFCRLKNEDVTAMVTESVENERRHHDSYLKPQKISPSKSFPEFRERIYTDIYIPLSTFNQLFEEVITSKQR